MSKLGPISHFPSPVSCNSLVLQGLRCECGAGVLNLVVLLSHSLILASGCSTWHLMAKNSLRIWEKELMLHIKMASPIRRFQTLWNWAAARWPRPYSGLTGQVPLRTGLAMVNQRSWVHMLSVISRGCLWKIDVWVLPALLQRLKGLGVSLSVLRPYGIHKEASSKDDAKESLQTVCWRQAD